MKFKTIESQIEIVNLYIDQKLSLEKIAKRFNVSLTCILKTLERRGIKTRTSSEAARKYHFDEHYFEKIDSNKKAQILGFIAADGFVYSRGNYGWYLSIALNAKDVDYLSYIRSELQHPKPVKNFEVKGKSYAKVDFISTILVKDLNDKGIFQGKSLTHEFPEFSKVPEQFIKHYILGYFEGDGCLHLGKKKIIDPVIQICASKPFCEKFKEYVSTKLNISIRILPSRSKIWYIRLDGASNVEKFLDWIYSDTQFVMKRKYESYLKFKENRKLAEIKKEENKKLAGETIKQNNSRRDYTPMKSFMKEQRKNHPELYDNQLRKIVLINNKTQELLTIIGIKNFLRTNPQYNFHEPSISGLATGRIKKYKDWTLHKTIQ